MDQIFHGSVDQVAGRDIVNVTSDSFWSYEVAELRHEYVRCRRKLWQARRDIFISIPFFWFVMGAIGSAWLLLSGMWFRISGQIWMFLWIAGASLIPALWLTALRQRKGKMVAYYHQRMEAIDIVIQDKT